MEIAKEIRYSVQMNIGMVDQFLNHEIEEDVPEKYLDPGRIVP